MAPEQARGDVSRIGPVTDIWAVGMIVFRLLSGSDYWDGDVATHFLAQIVYEPIVAPSKRGCPLADAFDAWILRSSHRDLTARFQTAKKRAKALAEALRALTNDTTRGLRPCDHDEQTNERSGRPKNQRASRSAKGGRKHTPSARTDDIAELYQRASIESVVKPGATAG